MGIGSMTPRYEQVSGWVAVALSTVFACFWAFWGIIENFHEGCFHPSLWGGPLLFMGVAYWFGRPDPRRWAVSVLLVLPLITLLVCGAEPAYRVSGRLNDGNRSARRIAQNGVDLTWAPEGPGWPRDGVPWAGAMRRCRSR